MSNVLVTGGSGFIGSHCIVQLLAAGHAVRTTVRDLKRADDVRALVRAGGGDPANLTFAAADLMKDDGWDAAAAGCEYVLHVASPFPANAPKHEDELIVPAREGALRLLRAAKSTGVKRVVLTSSFAAVGYGHEPSEKPFDETTWTNVDGAGVSAYAKSKTLAERAAWDFIDKEGGALELATVNPVVVCGPVLGADYSTSIVIVQRMLDGKMPGCPRINFGLVDVRDVADLHLRAMTNPAAKGERFLAVAGDFMWMVDIAKLLVDRLGAQASKVKTRQLPNWLVRMAAMFDGQVRQIVPELGKPKNATHAKATRLLGWQPRSNEDAVVATAQSLIDRGLVKSAKPAAPAA